MSDGSKIEAGVKNVGVKDEKSLSVGSTVHSRPPPAQPPSKTTQPSQTTSHVLMVIPAAFGFNSDTATTNAFQQPTPEKTQESSSDVFKPIGVFPTQHYSAPPTTNKEIHLFALNEMEALTNMLTENGIHVHCVGDTTSPIKPDAIFPNNWVTFNANNTVGLFPMYHTNRRAERRMDIVSELSKEFHCDSIHKWYVDCEPEDKEPIACEGTGSLVFDHVNKTAYASLSKRTDLALATKICDSMGYEIVTFTSVDSKQATIYHTNVMISIADKFAVVCLDSIPDAKERATVLSRLEKHHKVIPITLVQMNSFAGNVLQLHNYKFEKVLAMSTCAYNAFTADQRKQITDLGTRIVHSPIPTIEKYGGGSVRCMIAEIFCSWKTK